ncbi:MAG: 50S ribosomal protein L4 [SAR202 cluster bacterium Io17-Chloro-G4]|nr:MAG: 50S ribosomal protein L4 [SAR202 cluster bacterium Io17-Chloro-G4]
MEIPVKNQDGETVETINLDDAVYNVPMNNSLVHQALVTYQLNKRQGTHDTKTRAQVSGGGRKPWIQKHTGRARQGSIRSPQWRHGGVVFGPHPRSYRKALPKRYRRLALKCVLSDKARQDRLVCLNSMDTLDGKTKSMVSLLENLNISSSALVVTKESQQPVYRAAKNLSKIWTLPVNLLNAHELLRRDMVIMTVEAARWAEENLKLEPQRKRVRDDLPESAAAAVEEPPAVEVEDEPVAEVGAEPVPEVEAEAVAEIEDAPVAEETEEETPEVAAEVAAEEEESPEPAQETPEEPAEGEDEEET